MRILLLLFSILLFQDINGQYLNKKPQNFGYNYTQKDACISIGICITSFAIMDNQYHNMTKGQAIIGGLSGPLIAAGYSVCKTLNIYKRIQKRIRQNKMGIRKIKH
jgi:hypothetical protein